MDAQADLRLRWAHPHFVVLSCCSSNVSTSCFSQTDATTEGIVEVPPDIDSEEYSGLRAQDLQEAKDQLLVETADMLSIPLFTAEALLRNYGRIIMKFKSEKHIVT